MILIIIAATLAVGWIVFTIIEMVSIRRTLEAKRREKEHEYIMQRLIKFQIGDKTYRSN